MRQTIHDPKAGLTLVWRREMDQAELAGDSAIIGVSRGTRQASESDPPCAKPIPLSSRA